MKRNRIPFLIAVAALAAGACATSDRDPGQDKTAREWFVIARALETEAASAGAAAEEPADSILLAYSNAIRLDPGFEEAYLHRGLWCLRSGHAEQAAWDFGWLVGQDPENVAVLRYRGLAYEALGKKDLASKDRQEADRIEQGFPEWTEALPEPARRPKVTPSAVKQVKVIYGPPVHRPAEPPRTAWRKPADIQGAARREAGPAAQGRPGSASASAANGSSDSDDAGEGKAVRTCPARRISCGKPRSD